MNLFPKSTKPYVILSPSYTHKSSGVRTLHLLCHALNESGQKAYMAQDKDDGYILNPFLNTPYLSSQHWEYLKETQDFIAVYPDIVRGNPLGAKNVVRYLLAPRGAYGGDSIFLDSDQIWGALPSIADKVLRIPVSDTNIFYHHGILSKIGGAELYFPPKDCIRRGECFYSHKYEMHGKKVLDITKDSVKLEGSLEKLADILRKSEVCYLYELSSVITEAALCGCPVVLIRTPYFNSIDSSCMMGDVTWDDGEIVKVCTDYLPEYREILRSFDSDLRDFIRETQGAS